MNFNLTNLPPKEQESFWLSRPSLSLRHSLQQGGVSHPFHLRRDRAIAYRGYSLLESAVSEQSTERGNCPILFSIQAVQPGQSDFFLLNCSLWAWLNCCWQRLLVDSPAPSNSTASQGDFPIQYAHARCCSILRLAADIPALQTTLQGQSPFRESHPTDLMANTYRRSLLQQWVDMMDAMDDPYPNKKQIIGRKLGFAALKIIRYRLGSVLRAYSTQSRIEIGLILLVQRQLGLLLEQVGAIALTEL